MIANIALLALTYALTLTVGASNSIIDLASFTSGLGSLDIIGGASNQIGNSVSIAGDFNGDGTQDFVVGAPSQGTNGAAFIFIGGTSTLQIDASTFTSGSMGLKIIGATIGDQLGYSVGAAGDINNDGYDDYMIGAPGADLLLRPNAGFVYMIFGRPGPYTDMSLTLFTAGSLGFKIIGAASNTQLGSSPTCLRGSLGDINGDGIDDFAIGSAHVDFQSRSAAGAVYIIYGKQSTSTVVNIDLAVSLGTSGVVIGGSSAGDNIGSSISGAGDINGDGINDLLIGCTGCDPEGRSSAGAAYLIYCAHSMTNIDLNGFTTGTSGFLMIGGSADDLLGTAVSNCGDLNGDGLSDIVVGAPGVTKSGIGHDVGCVTVIYGTETVLTSNIDMLNFATDSTGYVICGTDVGAKLGAAVSSAGDFNLDGVGDLLIGCGGNHGCGGVGGDACAVAVPGVQDIRHHQVNLTHATDICIILPPILGSTSLGISLDGAAMLTQQDGIPNLLIGMADAKPLSLLDSLFRQDAGATYVVSCTPAHTASPTRAPSQAAGTPTKVPTRVPTVQPGAPTVAPTACPTETVATPTACPTTEAGIPTAAPSNAPTPAPQPIPVPEPTASPVCNSCPHPNPVPVPTGAPVAPPTECPTAAPGTPTTAPTNAPTPAPVPQPVPAPTTAPVTVAPTDCPTAAPGAPTSAPVPTPTAPPVSAPTMCPTAEPGTPTNAPVNAPVSNPVPNPVPAPVNAPVSAPVNAPVNAPVSTPVSNPVSQPVNAPVNAPVSSPVAYPVNQPVNAPVSAPVSTPVSNPVSQPVNAPVNAPVSSPVAYPVNQPVNAPVSAPVSTPVSNPVSQPVNAPVNAPVSSPVAYPVNQPVNAPVSAPVSNPVSNPVSQPVSEPVTQPVPSPVQAPVNAPYSAPMVTKRPTRTPTARPTRFPTEAPFTEPTTKPTRVPTTIGNHNTSAPTVFPTRKPTQAPTGPSAAPTFAPTANPTKRGGHRPVTCIVQQVRTVLQFT
jgi:hypothetical protein